MRADTWADVANAARNLASAFWSRLGYYVPSERARRAARDEANMARLRELFAKARDAHPWCGDEDDRPSDDATHVEAWMAENGFTARTTANGIDEQTEVAISAATEAFRARLGEIFGHDDFDFHVQVGLDSDDEDA